MADTELRFPRRKKGARSHPIESPFPVPIQNITNKDSCNSRWYYYFGYLRENSVIIERLGDLTFLYKMGFFGKGNLSRSKPEFDVVSDISQKAFSTSEKLRRLPPKERKIRQSKFREIRKERYQRHLSWSQQARQQSNNTSSHLEETNFEGATVDGRIEQEAAEPTCSMAIDESLLCLGDDVAAGSGSDVESFLTNSSGSSGAESGENMACPDENSKGNIHSSKNASGFNGSKKGRREDPYKVYEHLQLSLEEAFFLSYGLGCLTVYDTEQKPMTLCEMWCKFCSAKRNFLPTYIAYHYFRAKGWVPKVGIKYGSDFVLYKQGMPFYHSSYSIVVQMVDGTTLEPSHISNFCQYSNLSWPVLCGLGRVNEHAAKEVMICYIVKPKELTQDDMMLPSCIPRFTVQEVIMRRWIPERARDHEIL